MLSPKIFVLSILAVVIFSVPVLAQTNGNQTTNLLQQLVELLTKILNILTQLLGAPAAQTNIGLQGPVRIIGLPGFPYYNPAQYGGLHKSQHFAASEDIGKCGDWWNYTAVEGMSVVIKKKDGSFCSDFPVNICKKITENKNANTVGSQPYYYTYNLPSEGIYQVALNLPDGWGYATDPSIPTSAKDYASMFPVEMTLKKQGNEPSVFGFYISKGAPTPARISCDGGATTTQPPASTTTTIPPTTTTTSTTTSSTTTTTVPPTTTSTTTTTVPPTTTTSSSTTTTSAGLPDLNVSSYVRTNSANYYETSPPSGRPYSQYLNFSVRNIGTADAGAFNVNLTLQNSTLPYGFRYWTNTKRINSLAAGSTVYLTYNISGASYIVNPSVRNGYYVNITADYSNEISESNENNNFNSTFFRLNMTVWSGGNLNFVNSYTTYQG